jgi:hypothetical protein
MNASKTFGDPSGQIFVIGKVVVFGVIRFFNCRNVKIRVISVVIFAGTFAGTFGRTFSRIFSGRLSNMVRDDARIFNYKTLN